MAKKNERRLEAIIAVGVVVFMFLFVGILNIGGVQIFPNDGGIISTSSESNQPADISVGIPQIQLKPAISTFTVMES